jgi:tRNA modification GTPase
MASLLDPTDTIAAVASPLGSGFRGLVRLTGPDAIAIAEERFLTEDPLSPVGRAVWRRGTLKVRGLRPRLPAWVATWPGPRTYTGQPLAEIHTVGSPPLVQLVLADCLARGARHAQPGEFTLRAFLSGRIDLTRAEAVLGVIDAHTPAQLDAALRQLAGGLSGPITALRDRLLDVLAHLEAGLDFTEEPDVDPIGRAALARELERGADDVTALAERLEDRERPESAPRVVLIGPPNVGKSELFNALLGQSRALVSPQAGTTRDYLSAPCDCAGLLIELIDTAGIENASNPIDERAQTFRADQAARADLLLECRSGDTTPIPPTEVERPRLVVWTKSDVAPPDGDGDAMATSARTGAGLANLRASIAETLRRTAADGDLPASTGARCRESLIRAAESLHAASETLLAIGGDELVAIDLRQAVDDLGKVVGAIVTDDILDRIFRRFCVGK